MSAYTHTTSSTTRQPMLAIATEPVTGPHLLEATFGGKVTFGKVRASGTVRHWPVLKPGTSERKTAESVQAALSKGATVAAVAKEANVSVATLRRTLTALAFTLELEGLSAKDRTALAKVATENGKVRAAEQPAKSEPKAKSEPEAPKSEAKAPAKRSSRSAAPKGTKANPGKGGFVATTKAGKAAVERKARTSAKQS